MRAYYDPWKPHRLRGSEGLINAGMTHAPTEAAALKACGTGLQTCSCPFQNQYRAFFFFFRIARSKKDEGFRTWFQPLEPQASLESHQSFPAAGGPGFGTCALLHDGARTPVWTSS